jgi:hypothetical protein
LQLLRSISGRMAQDAANDSTAMGCIQQYPRVHHAGGIKNLAGAGKGPLE